MRAYSGPGQRRGSRASDGRDFARALGRALNRPAVLPVPAIGAQSDLRRGRHRAARQPAGRAARADGARFPLGVPDARGGARRHRARSSGDHRRPRRRQGKTPDTSSARRRSWTRHSIETFAFFSRAENLGLLTPASMKFSIDGVAPAMQTGSTIDYRIALGPVRVRWRTRIAEWEPWPRVRRRAGRRAVRTLARIATRSRTTGLATVMDDRVRYTPPFGLLGRIAHRLFIAPALRRIFQYRSDVIRLRFG